MKKIIVILLMVIGLSSCDKEKRNRHQESHIQNEYSVILIDSCEYIFIMDGYRLGITHKGNCSNTYHMKE